MAAKKPVASQEKKEELGALAGQTARHKIEEECAKAGLTVEKVARTVANALEANVVRAVINMEGQFVYSKPLSDHVTRLKAVERAEVLLDLKPTEKIKVDGIATISDEAIDRRLEQLMGKGNK